MTEMPHDERLARRVQAAEDRKSPRANPDDERDAVRSRAMKRKRMMLSTISPVQKQALTGTAINQVLVKCRWKAKLHKHLQQA